MQSLLILRIFKHAQRGCFLWTQCIMLGFSVGVLRNKLLFSGVFAVMFCGVVASVIRWTRAAVSQPPSTSASPDCTALYKCYQCDVVVLLNSFEACKMYSSSVEEIFYEGVRKRIRAVGVEMNSSWKERERETMGNAQLDLSVTLSRLRPMSWVGHLLLTGPHVVTMADLLASNDKSRWTCINSRK